MEEKHNKATHNRPFGDRPLDAPIVNIDLHAYTQQIKDEDAWHKNDRNAITVFKTGDMHIVLTAMHKGAELLPQTTEAILCVQVLEGYIHLTTDSAIHELNAGHIITLHEHISYNIIAAEESVFLLTLCGSQQKDISAHTHSH